MHLKSHMILISEEKKITKEGALTRSHEPLLQDGRDKVT